MKMSPDYVRAGLNMQPGKISRDGFLGSDPRPLVDIIAQDEEEIAGLGMSFESITEMLEALLGEGARGFGNPVIVRDIWQVTVDEARGSIPCPFQDRRFSKRYATITHRASGKTMMVSDLSLHLFARHHFLQGKGSPFRLEPLVLKQVLEL